VGQDTAHLGRAPRRPRAPISPLEFAIHHEDVRPLRRETVPRRRANHRGEPLELLLWAAGPPATSRVTIRSVALDCRDPRALATFYVDITSGRVVVAAGVAWRPGAQPLGVRHPPRGRAPRPARLDAAVAGPGRSGRALDARDRVRPRIRGGVVLRRTDADGAEKRIGAGCRTVAGEPLELLLWASGRRDVARATVS
jgi:hypothetical protein